MYKRQEIENLETAEDSPGRDLSCEICRLAVEIEVLRGAKRLEGVGHGKRQAGEGLATYGGLCFRHQKADIDAVFEVQFARLGDDGLEV